MEWNHGWGQWLALLLTAVLYWGARRILGRVVEDFAKRRQRHEGRTALALRSLNIGLFVLALLAVLLVLNIAYSQILLFLGSTLAVLGIALFAQWSILSNITASLVIFFAFPYRLGDRVKVVDKDDDVSGVIENITSFHVQIRRDSGDLVNYPNNLILQKAVILLALGQGERQTQPEGSEAKMLERRFARQKLSGSRRGGAGPGAGSSE